MHPSASKPDNPIASWMIFPIACALAVVGVKCWIISHYGSPTPFWDQWDAEGAVLYPLYFGGTLNLTDLIALHKPLLQIPYPDAQRLALIASQPDVRALLPPALVGKASAARAQQHGLARFTGRPLEALKDTMLRWGILLTPVGVILFLLGFMTQRRRAVPQTLSP